MIWNIFKKVCPEVVIAEQFDDLALNNYMERRRTNGNISTHRTLKKASINRELGLLKNIARWVYKKRYLSSNYYDLVDKILRQIVKKNDLSQIKKYRRY